MTKEPEGEKKKDGTEWRIDAGVNLSVGDNRAVVGQTDGTAVTFGYKAEGQLEHRSGGHESRSRALSTVGLTQTPGLEDFVKSRDQVLVESIYLYHIVDWFGPFVRASVDTAILQGFDVREPGASYVSRETGEVLAPTGRRFPLTTAWRPTRFKQSLGAFFRALRWQPLNIETRLGGGAREVLARGQLAINDDDATEGLIEVSQLSNVYQVGGEGVLELWGNVEEKKVNYRASLEALVPFANSALPPEDDRDALDLTVLEFKAALSIKVVEWATVDYEVGVLREPLIIDDYQIRNSLLVNFGTSAGNLEPDE
ncbi:MAG: hypothetical protein AAGA56_29860 [Myxococcota bacterium]